MGRVTSNKMHYLTVNYLTRSVPRHFHRSFVKLGVISCHDPVTKYIYDCYQLNLTIENLNFRMSSNSPASIVCWNFFQIESCKHLKVFYNCCLHGILLGLFSFPLQDHIVSAVHRMVDQKEVLHFSTQNIEKKESMQKPGMTIFCWQGSKYCKPFLMQKSFFVDQISPEHYSTKFPLLKKKKKKN